MFPEREDGLGDIYIEAANKFRVKKLKEITFVNAKEIFGIIYSSKTGSTILKWRQINKKNGKVMGEASNSSLSNLVESGVLTMDWLNQHISSETHGIKLTK